jgi:hypothetical protein
MQDAAPTAERREQMLGLLAEKALALACAVQQRALEAETAEEMAQLSHAFVRLGRSVRQCIALHARHEKDRLRGEHEAAEAAAQARGQAIERRKRQLEDGVEAVLCADWDPEIEQDEGESSELVRSLHERLEDLSEAEDFLDLDPDQLIAQLCDDLAVEAARADAVLAPHKAPSRAVPPEPTPTPGSKPNGPKPNGPKSNGHAPEPPAANSS